MLRFNRTLVFASTFAIAGALFVSEFAQAQRFSTGRRGGSFGINISPGGISIGVGGANLQRGYSPYGYRSPVPVYRAPVSVYRAPISGYRGGVTISRATPYGYRSPQPIVVVPRSVTVPRSTSQYSSGYRSSAVAPATSYRAPTTSYRSTPTYARPQTYSGGRQIQSAVPSQDIPAYRPPEPLSLRSRTIRTEAIPAALRDAAERLSRSLVTKRDANVWLNYLNPGVIISTIDGGGSIAGLAGMRGSYNGVMNNRELSHVYSSDGFREIRDLLARVDEFEQFVASSQGESDMQLDSAVPSLEITPEPQVDLETNSELLPAPQPDPPQNPDPPSNTVEL